MNDVKLQPGKENEVTQHIVRMRPIELSDADVIAIWFQHLEDVSIFDRQVPLPMNHPDVVSLIKSLITEQDKQKCRWFIAENRDGTAIGMTGLEAINMLHGHAILPLFINESFRRSGVGIRMACMMIDLAFKQLRLHRVSTVYRADNKPSAVLLDQLGFKQEGVSRQSWFSHGQYFDLMNVGLLLEEWEQVRPILQNMLSPAMTVELGPRSSTIWRWPQTH